MATGQMYGVLVHDLQNSSLSPKSAEGASVGAGRARAAIKYVQYVHVGFLET